jgi:L-alanine-DL-glutamate epimerase-like enolase superfamily enzyme
MVRRQVWSLVFDSTIVGVETDSGLTGYGEVCPWGRLIFPLTLKASVPVCELGPHLLGFNLQLDR